MFVEDVHLFDDSPHSGFVGASVVESVFFFEGRPVDTAIDEFAPAPIIFDPVNSCKVVMVFDDVLEFARSEEAGGYWLIIVVSVTSLFGEAPFLLDKGAGAAIVVCGSICCEGVSSAFCTNIEALFFKEVT